jgi:hypothetical protein
MKELKVVVDQAADKNLRKPLPRIPKENSQNLNRMRINNRKSKK